MTQAYRYALDPTPEQSNLLRSHIGGTRFAYNALLELVQKNWNENQVRKASGEELTDKDYPRTGHLDLQTIWYQHRDELAPWWAENNSSTYNYACLNLSNCVCAISVPQTRDDTPRSSTYHVCSCLPENSLPAQ